MFQLLLYFFFFHDSASPQIYTLSLHDALPISPCRKLCRKLVEPELGLIFRFWLAWQRLGSTVLLPEWFPRGREVPSAARKRLFSVNDLSRLSRPLVLAISKQAAHSRVEPRA